MLMCTQGGPAQERDWKSGRKRLLGIPRKRLRRKELFFVGDCDAEFGPAAFTGLEEKKVE